MQRRVEAHDSLDDFPTPPWATRALCEHMAFADQRGMTCREPSANRGCMVKPLLEYFVEVQALDIHDYGVGFPVQDYLFPVPLAPVHWTICNPPFRLAEQFIIKALQESKMGVATLVRTAFLEGQGRHDRLFAQHRPSEILQFTERVVMHKGKLVPDGSTATAYCWVIWRKTFSGQPMGPTQFYWTGTCRKKLERPFDYVFDHVSQP